jgi:hypothetical protein
MKLGFDIFRLLDDGSPLWVAEVNSLVEARSRVGSLKQTTPGRYFARDAESGESIALDTDVDPGEVKKA